MTQTQPSVPDAVQPVDNPYVGPRPFKKEDSKRFYGRDQESNTLISMVIAERLVVFYAQSGAGKSSLINARLLPGLSARGFIVLSGRVSGAAGEGVQADNIFTYNLLLSLEHTLHPDQPVNQEALTHLTLGQYLSNLEVDAPEEVTAQIGENGTEDAKTQMAFIDVPQTIGGIQPLALIIDQFEELFTSNPGAWAQREPFFQQLCDAMEEDPYLWVVLTIREDYIAALDPFAGMLPGKLRARFYMQRMEHDAALQAVCRPVDQIREFDNAAATELVRNLSLIPVAKDEHNQPIYEPGQYIEPVQLQVVCYQLWEELRNRPGDKITLNDLNSLTKDNQKLANFISDALANFYVQAIEEVHKEFPHISKRKLREWFSKELITENETRSAVVQGKTHTGSPPNDLPNEVVKAFQDRFIIRGEVRGNNFWYELSHDRFVLPILQSNRDWQEKNPFPFEAAALAWKQNPKDPARLLDGQQLREAVTFKQNHLEELSPLARSFIDQSAEISRKKDQSRRQIATGVLSSLLILSLILAFVATRNASVAVNNLNVASTNADQAKDNAATAIVARQQAVENLTTAQVASLLEAQQRSTADIASTLAVIQQRAAEAASTQAVQNQVRAEAASTQAVSNLYQMQTAEAESRAASVKAQASRLSSLADYFRFSQPDLGLLLSSQAVNITDNWDSRKALLNSLQRGLKTQVKPAGSSYFTRDKPNSITYSPDGKLLVAALQSGDIQLYSQDPEQPQKTAPADFTSTFPVNAVAFSSDGKILARAGDGSSVKLWYLDTNKVLSVFPYTQTGTYYPFEALAFQPNGHYLAIAADRDQRSGKVFLYDLNNLSADKPAIYECGAGNCLSLAWSPDGSQLAVGSSSGDLRVYKILADGQLTTLWRHDRAHADQVWGLAWYLDNQRLVSGGLDQRLAEWDTGSPAVDPLAVSLRANSPSVYHIALSPSGRFLVVGGVTIGRADPSKYVTVWDADTLQRKLYDGLISAHKQPVTSVAFMPNGDTFATAGMDNMVRQWNFQPVDPLGQTVWTVAGKGRMDGLNVTADGRLTAAETEGDQVRVWTDQVEQPLSYPLPHKSLAFNTVNGSPVIVLGGADGKVTAVDPATGKNSELLPQFPVTVVPHTTLVSVALSSDGKQVAAAACSTPTVCNRLYLVDVSGSQPVSRTVAADKLSPSVITALAYNADGSKLAVGTSNGFIYLVDTVTLDVSQVATEGIQLGNVALIVTSLTFGPPDLDLLAAGFFDRRVALWEGATLDPVGVFDERVSGKVTAITFRQDPEKGWALVSASAAGDVRQWDITKESWIARACQMAGRNLTRAEVLRFFTDSLQPADICPNLPKPK